MRGIKYDQKKIDWSLLPFEEIEEVVKVLMYGAKKYDIDNWKYVEPYKERYFSACIRHLIARFRGEIIDSESKLPHLAHAVCCILFLMYKDKNKKE
jgi:hypothetical protein